MDEDEMHRILDETFLKVIKESDFFKSEMKKAFEHGLKFNDQDEIDALFEEWFKHNYQNE